MKNIHSLIHNLQPSEIEIIRTSLKSYYSKDENDFKTLKLFDYLLKNKTAVPSPNECSLHIYGKPKDNTIDKLASRLKSKILDALTLDVNIERKGLLDEQDTQVLKVKKKLMQFMFLYRSRGNHPLVNQLLDDIIGYSKKYELFSSIVEGLKYKKYFKGYTRGLDDFNKLNKEIEFYEHCENAVDKANDAYYRLIIRADFHGNIDKRQLQRYLHESIVDLTNEYKFTGSASVGYYLKLLELAYLHNNEDMLKARDVCQELLQIVEGNKAVYRKQRVGFAYGNMIQCDIYLGNYDSAVKNARAMMQYTPTKGVNFIVAKELEFHTLFYSNKLEDAEKVLDILLKAAPSQQGDFRVAKFRFYYANVLFKKKNYKGALKELLQNANLSKDKIGWEFAIRVLTIMTLIELDSLDEAEKHVDSLRKHIERHETKNDIRVRDDLILKQLQRLQKRGFVFDKPVTEELSFIELLSADKKKYKWEPFSPELIPFHTWLMGKFGMKKITAARSKAAANTDEE
jgi:tetratricopeptide (TPR) repeat protein